MAQLNDDMRAIMVQSQAERRALFVPVSEISRRLQPRHLANVAAEWGKQKAAKVVGGVSDTVMENGGTAAAFALGAIALFYAGRRTAEKPPGVEVIGRTAKGTPADLRSNYRGEARPRRAITNLTRVKMLARAAGSLSLGHVIGRLFDTTAKERAVFGKAGAELHNTIDRLIIEHGRGAKVAAAQAFGFANYAAALLIVLSAASDYFVRVEGGNDSSNR